jgi:hypothetical protein
MAFAELIRTMTAAVVMGRAQRNASLPMGFTTMCSTEHLSGPT